MLENKIENIYIYIYTMEFTTEFQMFKNILKNEKNK